jgi:hypothetical protein
MCVPQKGCCGALQGVAKRGGTPHATPPRAMNSYFFLVEDDFFAVFFAVPQGPFDLHAIIDPPSLKC